jgi:sortase (surface protein transpeptidase)
MTTTHRGLSGRTAALVFGLAAMMAAVALVIVVVKAQESAPTPHDSGRIDAGSSQSTQHRTPGTKQGTKQGTKGSDQGVAQTPPPLPASRPVSLSIPAIGVHTVVNQLGLAADGTLAVPQLGPHLNQAAWFENSPTPGQPGPSIIEGHVDSVEGVSVFFKLGAVKPGDRIVVRRADGRTLTFEVNAVRDYLKASFPTTVVYGGKDLSQPTLRLITCSDFDASIHHHVGNEVVFAHLVHATRAS